MLIHLIHLENQSSVSILVFPPKKIKRYTVFMISCRSCISHALALAIIWWTASFVGSAGIAPIPVTVIAPQAFAKRRASFNFFSLCRTKSKLVVLVWSYHAFFNNILGDEANCTLMLSIWEIYRLILNMEMTSSKELPSL